MVKDQSERFTVCKPSGCIRDNGERTLLPAWDEAVEVRLEST